MQDTLQQQLANAVKARKLLEDTYEHQFKLLAQFVSRLSLACKGTDLDLDNRLARLRQELTRGTDLEKLLPFIEQTTENLKHLENQQQQGIKHIQQELTEAGKQLQKQRGLPDQLRRDLRQLLHNIEQPAATIYSFLPYLTQLASLYQEALQASQQLINSDETRYAHTCRRISNELEALLEQLTLTEYPAEHLTDIRQLLRETLSIDSLLDACIKTISMIVSSVQNERQSAEHFLLKLNSALSSVQQSVLSSLSSNQQQQERVNTLRQQIEQKITHLSQETEQATTLEQLKTLVNHKLLSITDSLREKEQLEQQQHQQLFQTLQTMEVRLHELEREASSFQSRIAEQRFRSLQDALTEIPNRAAFDERYQLEISRWQRYRKPLTLVVADVDHFKRINDNYGHSAGDKTLKAIAKALKQSLRETDFIARYGGEEFIMLFPETTLEDIEIPLNKIRTKINNIAFKFKNQSVPITLSFGATQLRNDDSSRSAFDRADEALYEAKKAGRDTIVFKA
ncbi:diguanylate cyclase [Chromatiaceae bacterium AAb-1]|nr:diguanylate cyclase [Chromatiaceae bacterium AAb-1]